VTFEDKEWIDETGKASDQSGTTWLNAGSWNFNTPAQAPSKFSLATKAQKPVKVETLKEGTIIDFGKETFGFVQLKGLKGKGKVEIFMVNLKKKPWIQNTAKHLINSLSISRLPKIRQWN
jgi:hypothetical protein